MDGTTPLLHFSAGHTQVKCLFMWYDCLPSRVWGTCSQCTTESDSQRSTFQSSLCRPHRAIWDPHKGGEFILVNRDWEGRRPNAGSPLAPNDACHFKFPRTSEDPFCEIEGLFFLKRHCDHCVCSYIRASNGPLIAWNRSHFESWRGSWLVKKAHQPGNPKHQALQDFIGFQTAKITILDTWNLESLNRVEQLKWNDISNSWHFVTMCGLHVNGACKWSRCKKHSTKSFATSLAWTLRIWRDMRRTHTFNLARPWIQEQKLLQDALNKQHNAAWKRLPPGGQKKETRELGICNTIASKLELHKNKQE